MNIIFIVIYFTLTFLSKVTTPCGTFNCPPYSNNAMIKYTVQPSEVFTYNSDNTTSVAGQNKGENDLKAFLKTLADDAVKQMNTKVPPANRQFFTITHTLNDAQSKLLQATIIPGNCPSATSNPGVNVTAAEKDTFFVKEKILYKRVEPTLCNNGAIVSEKYENVTITIVYDFRVKILTGQTMCKSHWKLMQKTLKNVIQSKNAVVVLDGEISKL
uniref:NTR domain-containing protein n=1 Tax=Parastrongyloides trichosuri TaxID=131310 RepID=A0A0N5A0S2_PARTI